MSKLDPELTVDTLVEAARAAEMTAPAIERLAERVAASGDMAGAVDRALATTDPDTAARLMLAAAAAGCPPTAQQVARVLPFIDSIEQFPVLVGCATGDRVEMLLDVVERGQLSRQRDVLALFLVSELLDGDPPPRFLVRLRLVSRSCFDPNDQIILGLAAMGIDDPDTREVLADCIAWAEAIGPGGAAAELRRLLQGPPLQVLPKHEPPKVVSGFTVRRAVEKVGRNAPCPCGSGKKYKKCCLKKDLARLSDPSPVEGMTMSEYVDRAGELMPIDEFRSLRPREMRGLDLEALPWLHLLVAVRKFTEFAYWADAERAMAILAQRDGTPDDADGYREELIGAAVEAGVLEVARRQADLLDEPSELYLVYRLALEMAESDDAVLQRLEDAAIESLAEDAEDPFCIPYALLPRFPALGITTARAHLDPARSLDSEVLLEAVEEARDRLQLPPGDPGGERYQELAYRHEEDLLDAAHARALSEQNEALVAEVESLRLRLDVSASESRSLDQSLREATSRLVAARAGTPSDDASPTRAVRPGAEQAAAQDAEALRRKVTDLKTLISQGNDERAALRRQFALLKDELRKVEAADLAAKPDRATGHDGATDHDDDLEIEAELPARTAVLIPTFGPHAAAALRDAPPRLASAAVRLAGSLATGDDARWQGVKRLRATKSLLSARVGIHHRLLFEMDQDAGKLVVAEFIHRRDLEKAVSRYR